MLVDDHEVVRQGIKAILAKEKDISVIAEASEGNEAVRLSKSKSPDVIIMDITLPGLNGLEASLQILKQNHVTKILVLSMHENRAFIEKALDYGVKGYMLKDSVADEIAHAIREVNSGRYFLSAKISTFVVNEYVRRRKGKMGIELKSASLLTQRERQVLQLIAEGLQNKDIAVKLKIAVKTVLTHRNSIMQKLDMHNQAQLIRFALREGIASL